MKIHGRGWSPFSAPRAKRITAEEIKRRLSTRTTEQVMDNPKQTITCDEVRVTRTGPDEVRFEFCLQRRPLVVFSNMPLTSVGDSASVSGLEIKLEVEVALKSF